MSVLFSKSDKMAAVVPSALGIAFCALGVVMHLIQPGVVEGHLFVIGGIVLLNLSMVLGKQRDIQSRLMRIEEKIG